MIVLLFGKPKVLNFSMWFFAVMAIYVATEFALFFIIGWILKKTVADLAGPYIAFAVPGALIVSLVWWVWSSEERGAEPKRIARRWGLSMALFGAAITGAICYSCIALRLVNSTDAIDILIAGLLGTLVCYFGMYHMTLPRISDRASGVGRGAGPR